MRRSYSALEQGQGSGTVRSGRPAATACASTRVRRTACIATRSAASLKVVRSPTTSSPWPRRSWRVQALSLPELQERRTRGGVTSGGRGGGGGGGGAGVDELLGNGIEPEVESAERTPPQAHGVVRLSEHQVVHRLPAGNAG